MANSHAHSEWRASVRSPTCIGELGDVRRMLKKPRAVFSYMPGNGKDWRLRQCKGSQQAPNFRQSQSRTSKDRLISTRKKIIGGLKIQKKEQVCCRKELRNYSVEVNQSMVPPRSFGVDHFVAKKEDTVQREPAQAKKQSSVIHSSRIRNKMEALSGDKPC